MTTTTPDEVGQMCSFVGVPGPIVHFTFSCAALYVFAVFYHFTIAWLTLQTTTKSRMNIKARTGMAWNNVYVCMSMEHYRGTAAKGGRGGERRGGRNEQMSSTTVDWAYSSIVL